MPASRADQARMRPDLSELKPDEKKWPSCSFSALDAATSRYRPEQNPHPLRETLLSLCSALERVLDLNSKGALILLTLYQFSRSLDKRTTSASLLTSETAASKGPIA